ncbi:aminotransferase class V-fold PLP-dependent enzyme [Streptomyces sp. M19]
MRRPWFAGGTIQVASAQGQWHRMADDESAFEDGTLNFLAIPDVEVGLEWIRAIGVDAVHDHVTALTGRLLDGLGALRHRSGAPMARLYGPEGTEGRGGTVALNLLDPHGRIVDERAVARTRPAAASPAHRLLLQPRRGRGRLRDRRARAAARRVGRTAPSTTTWGGSGCPPGRRTRLPRPVLQRGRRRGVPVLRRRHLPGPRPGTAGLPRADTADPAPPVPYPPRTDRADRPVSTAVRPYRSPCVDRPRARGRSRSCSRPVSPPWAVSPAAGPPRRSAGIRAGHRAAAARPERRVRPSTGGHPLAPQLLQLQVPFGPG